ncbi:MAG: 50S ribosomal protein L15 [Bdellovibrionales bacterium]|jgi:large subunit ribosomal protein L15|nr:50S ribosomal protein L15 [Bdellovibrionales bacterium]
MLKLNELKPQTGSSSQRKRLGRGSGSGLGPTAGKGDKGQLQRSGGSVRPGFEGGQTPLYRRLPKRGFTNIHARNHAAINLSDLETKVPSDVKELNLKVLIELGLAKKNSERLVILGNGTLTRSFKIQAHRVSESANKKITAAGGSIEIVKIQ